MISKDRVRKAILHQQPDQVPANFECVSSVMEKLLKHYSFNEEEQVYQKFDIDIRTVSPKYIGPELKSYQEGGCLVEESYWGWKTKYHWTGKEFNGITSYFPLDELETVEQLENYSWPSADYFTGTFNDIMDYTVGIGAVPLNMKISVDLSRTSSVNAVEQLVYTI